MVCFFLFTGFWRVPTKISPKNVMLTPDYKALFIHRDSLGENVGIPRDSSQEF